MAVAERRPEIKIPFLGIIPWTFKELSVPWGLYPGDRFQFPDYISWRWGRDHIEVAIEMRNQRGGVVIFPNEKIAAVRIDSGAVAMIRDWAQSNLSCNQLRQEMERYCRGTEELAAMCLWVCLEKNRRKDIRFPVAA